MHSTKTQTSDKQIGETYERNRYEIHVRSWYDTKDGNPFEPSKPWPVAGWGPWSVHSRNATTLEAAQAQLTDERGFQGRMASFIALGRAQWRIVKVTATCEVVA